MSSLVGATPVLSLSLRNHLFNLSYPERGTVYGVVDTGYDGFIAVPGEVFAALGLDEMTQTSRNVFAADGRRVELRSSLASVEIPDTGRTFDGQVESAAGMDEILVGTRLLSEFKLTLDYCGMLFRTEPCR